VRFFNYDNKLHRLLRLTGGTDVLKNFVVSYTKRLKRYKYLPLKAPVIILLDNDSGLSGFAGMVANLFGVKMGIVTCP
jgi:hypothetical protein